MYIGSPSLYGDKWGFDGGIDGQKQAIIATIFVVKVLTVNSKQRI